MTRSTSMSRVFEYPYGEAGRWAKVTADQPEVHRYVLVFDGECYQAKRKRNHYGDIWFETVEGGHR